MSFDWKSLVKSAAPIIGGALGGPVGGAAVAALANGLLGEDEVKGKTIEEKQKLLENTLMNNPSPEILAKLKEIDAKFDKEMKELDIDLERVHAADRNSARERERVMNDNTPKVLAYMVTIGFFAVLGLLVFASIPATAINILNIILGALCTAWISIIQYYYGSSKGSSDKNFLSHIDKEDLKRK